LHLPDGLRETPYTTILPGEKPGAACSIASVMGSGAVSRQETSVGFSRESFLAEYCSAKVFTPGRDERQDYAQIF
jgi:hypothetical protein